MTHRKFLRFVLIAFLLALTGVAAFNYAMDPAGLFRSSDYERGIADIIIAKQNAANLRNYNDRLLQKYIIEKSDKPCDILALGSSRVFQIRASFFPRQSFFNNGVSGGSLEDMIAIFTMHMKRQQFPQKVILGLDAWILNKYNDERRWRSLYEEYDYAVTSLGLDKDGRDSYFEQFNYRRYTELLSLPYLRESFVKLLSDARYGNYYATLADEAEHGHGNMRRADGSLSYSRRAATDEIRQSAISAANQIPQSVFRKFTRIDPVKKRNLELFVQYLQRQKIEVVFFFAPYHPLYYKALSANAAAIEAQRYFSRLARCRGIEVIGSHDPAMCGMTEADFYDGTHPSAQAVARIFRETARPEGDLGEKT